MWDLFTNAILANFPIICFLKASIVGELMFLDDDSLLEKMPLVKADERDDAGPLPVKVHIDATTL